MEYNVNVRIIQRESHSIFNEDNAVKQNVKEVSEVIEKSESGQLLIFPELSLTGYIPLKGYDQKRKAKMWESAVQLAEGEMESLKEATKKANCTVVIGLPEPAGPRFEMYNSALVIESGQIVGVQRKLHLPVEENHYFVPGDSLSPIDAKVGKLGIMVCYDMLFPEVSRILALQGSEILVVISNWIDDANLRRLGEILPISRSLENQVPVIFCNGVGELSVRQYRYQLYGRSQVVSATGQVLAQGDPNPGEVRAQLQPQDLLEAAMVFPIFRDRRIEMYADIVKHYRGQF